MDKIFAEITNKKRNKIQNMSELFLQKASVVNEVVCMPYDEVVKGLHLSRCMPICPLPPKTTVVVATDLDIRNYI